MRFAVSIVSPPRFVHSEAFREVGETLQAGLIALGHEAQLTTAVAVPGHRSIILGSNLLRMAGLTPPPDAVLYNLEQIDVDAPPEGLAYGANLIELFRTHLVWDYSQLNIAKLTGLGVPAPVHVPLGYVPALTRIKSAAEPDIDVLFYGSVNPRRRAILEALAAAGVKVEAVYGVYGPERDRLIARSKIVLNVHFYETKVFEIVRVSYLLANRKLVVSERGADPAEERPFEGSMAFAPYDRLVATCLALLEKPSERDRLAAAGFACMTDRPMERYLAPALTRLVAREPDAPTQEAAPASYYGHARPEVVAAVAPRGKRILDVGCASGAMGAAMLAAGATEVVGIEYHPPAAQAARTRLAAVFCADLATLPPLPYPPGYFDCITFADVLEHLANPEAVLRYLRPYLARDGLIVCSIPNVRHESVVLPLLIHGRWDYVDAGILDRTHLRFFTLQSALKLLVDAGFKPTGPVSGVPSPPSAELQRATAFVQSLGGDGARFETEARVIQYLVTAAVAAPDQHPARAPDVPYLWSGSRPTRLLLAPPPEQPVDAWMAILRAALAGPGNAPSVTTGLALPKEMVVDPPAALRALGDELGPENAADLLLLEAPADEPGWERLLAGASLVITTAPSPDLLRVARVVGTEAR